VGHDDSALGKRNWKNLAKNRQICQNHLGKAAACFASDDDDDDDDDDVIGSYLLKIFQIFHPGLFVCIIYVSQIRIRIHLSSMKLYQVY
jgi:hypothetical protein